MSHDDDANRITHSAVDMRGDDAVVAGVGRSARRHRLVDAAARATISGLFAGVLLTAAFIPAVTATMSPDPAVQTVAEAPLPAQPPEPPPPPEPAPGPRPTHVFPPIPPPFGGNTGSFNQPIFGDPYYDHPPVPPGGIQPSCGFAGADC